MAVEHERHRPHEYQDYIDRVPENYNATGWGVILGIAALLAILGMLFLGADRSPRESAPQSTIERTAPTSAPINAPTPAPATK